MDFLGVQFWFLAISGAGKVSLTTVCQWGMGAPIVPVCTTDYLGFLDPLCAIIPPSSVY